MLSTCSSPVDEWCRDLGAWCEPECMTYLQSKPIFAAVNGQAAANVKAASMRWDFFMFSKKVTANEWVHFSTCAGPLLLPSASPWTRISWWKTFAA